MRERGREGEGEGKNEQEKKNSCRHFSPVPNLLPSAGGKELQPPGAHGAAAAPWPCLTRMEPGWIPAPRRQRPPPSLGASPAAAGLIGKVWESNPPVEAPPCRPAALPPASMGSCLSSAAPASPPLAQQRPALRPPGRARVSTGPFPQWLRDWRSPKPGAVMEAPRRLPAQSPPDTTAGPESHGRWGLWRVRHQRRLYSPVTIKVAPPECQGTPCAPPEQGPPTEDHPDPVAEEPAPQAPSWARKGARKLHEPLWFEIQGRKGQTRDLEPRPSALKPLVGTAGPCFAPRPGPLSRSRCPWSYNVRKDRALGRAASPPATAPGQGAEPPLDT